MPTSESPARTISEYPLLGWTGRIHPKFDELTPGELVQSAGQRPNKTLYSFITRAGRSIQAQQAIDANAQRQMDEILDSHTSDATLLVQIGANDGQYDDPFTSRISRLGWRALLVEPQLEPFSALAQYHANNPRVRCVRTAIDEEHDQLTLWKLATRRHDEFRSATASVSPVHPGKEYRRWIAPIGLKTPPVTPEVVPAMSLSGLFQRAGIQPGEVTIFATDTEGLDVSIVRSLVSTGAKPSVILWEHMHASRQATDTVDHMLSNLGYDTSLRTSKDSMAFLPA